MRGPFASLRIVQSAQQRPYEHPCSAAADSQPAPSDRDSSGNRHRRHPHHPLTRDLAEARAALTRRRGFEETASLAAVRRTASAASSAATSRPTQVVDRILGDVRDEGDAAVRRYTEAFDGAAPAAFEVPKAEWGAALAALDPELASALRISAADRSPPFTASSSAPPGSITTRRARWGRSSGRWSGSGSTRRAGRPSTPRRC